MGMRSVPGAASRARVMMPQTMRNAQQSHDDQAAEAEQKEKKVQFHYARSFL